MARAHATICVSVVLIVGGQSSGQGLPEVLLSVESKVSQSNFKLASEYLKALDVEKVASTSRAASDKRYLAVEGFTLVVPGIPDWRKKSSTTIPIPGTSDVQKSSAEIDFNDIATGFATDYNMLIRHLFFEAVAEKGEVELSTVRRELDIPEELWSKISLRSRLRIRNIAEIAVKHEQIRR
ncbi:MAG: hypothetical protein U0930_07210 [Pirellulales bacterium]